MVSKTLKYEDFRRLNNRAKTGAYLIAAASLGEMPRSTAPMPCCPACLPGPIQRKNRGPKISLKALPFLAGNAGARPFCRKQQFLNGL